jgi:hypothetical protein
VPISPIFVARFLQLVSDRKFTEAERVLERLEEKVPKTEWNKGYLTALSGILLTQKTKDEYTFLSNLDFNNRSEVRKYRLEFLQSAKDELHSDYDRGFFSAWAEYMRISLKRKPIEE